LRSPRDVLLENVQDDPARSEFEQHRWTIGQRFPGAREALDDAVERRAAEVAEEQRAYRDAGGTEERPPGTAVNMRPFSMS
jgi:hypothetical protein